jgi:DnaJ-class molecular chaperone
MSAARKARLRRRAAGLGHRQRTCWGGCGRPIPKRTRACGALGSEEERFEAYCRACGGTGDVWLGDSFGDRCRGCDGRGVHPVCRDARLDGNGYLAPEGA